MKIQSVVGKIIQPTGNQQPFFQSNHFPKLTRSNRTVQPVGGHRNSEAAPAHRGHVDSKASVDAAAGDDHSNDVTDRNEETKTQRGNKDDDNVDDTTGRAPMMVNGGWRFTEESRMV